MSPTPSTDDVLEVPVRWDAVFTGEARAALERALASFIPARRWYRTKTKSVQSATIVAACPLVFGPDQEQMQFQARIVLAELLLDDGARETYVVPLAFVGQEALAAPEGAKLAVIAPLRAGGRAGAIVDALGLEAFASELLAAMGRNERIEEGKATMHFHGLAPVRDSKGGALRARVLSGEQTNTSILFGDTWVGKIVRKIDPGESADLEMGRFLTGVGYTHTPELAGWIDARVEHGEASTVGLLHAFVPNRGDAWGHALAVLDGWLAAAPARGGAVPELPRGVDRLSLAGAPLPAEVTSAVGPYAALAEKLGQRVGEMHAALVSRPQEPAFAPQPLDHATRVAIANAARTDLEQALDALSARASELPEAARMALSAVRADARGLEARLDETARHEDAGVKMRVHGDLHLGQVLFTGSDFMLIDFEGEPARPLAERKAKRSPLVDVAGMLRSYHYASVSALRATPAPARAALAPWASLWLEAVSASFLRGWLGAVQGTPVVPRDRAALGALLDLFLLEKAVYEVRYEMNNRPDWVEIPLEGLRAILGGGAPPVASEGAARPSSPPGRPSSPPVASSLLDPTSPRVAAFMAGTSTHAHRVFGAHPHQDGATDFAVWAPHAAHVAVVGDFNGWDGEAAVLTRVGSTGIHAGRVRGAAAGQRYKLRITPPPGASGAAGVPFDKADPFGVASEVSPGNASVVADLEYAWGDGAWMEKRVQNARMDLPLSIYEVHLGSWRRDDADPARLWGYREIAAPLAEHAKSLGFTHVELMPLLEHPFYGSWGYGVTGFFAATSRYGSPTDLMFLVDTLHRAGLGVILDWVPAHFARDPQGLAAFDGAPLFESADPARAVHPTWGSGVFDLSRPEVRSFLLSSATFWIETFHADGLRVDGVESLLYLDHHGGAEDEEGASFLRQLTTALKAAHPEVLLAAEDSSPWKGVTHAVKVGGLGFDLKWDMGFSHDLRGYLGIDPIQRSKQQGVLTFRSVYSASESFVLPLSHDDVIEERGGSLLQQMHGDPWQKLANLRLLYAMAWAQPGKKLLFMGDEFAQPGAWHHDRGLDWRASHEPAQEGIARMVGDLNRVYREFSALHAGDALPGGFDWIDGSNADMSIIAFVRRGRSDDDVVVVVCNFTPVPRHQYRVGMPRSGHWREIFNSDARDYGGSGHGNLGGIDAVPYPWNGRASSVVLTLPPLGAIFLARG